VTLKNIALHEGRLIFIDFDRSSRTNNPIVDVLSLVYEFVNQENIPLYNRKYLLEKVVQFFWYKHFSTYCNEQEVPCTEEEESEKKKQLSTPRRSKRKLLDKQKQLSSTPRRRSMRLNPDRKKGRRRKEI